MMKQYKKCSKCNKIKSLDEYYKHKTTKDGLNSECISCAKEHSKQQNDIKYKNSPVRLKKQKQARLYLDGKKQCSYCEEIKSLKEYYKNTKHKDELQYECKDCKKEHGVKYRAKPEVKAYKKEHDAKYRTKPENKAYKKEYDIECYQKNREAILEQKKEYNAKPETKERRNRRNKERRKNDPIWALKQDITNRFNHAFNNIGNSKAERATFELINCTWDKLEKFYFLFINKPCSRCKNTIITGDHSTYQTDHIIPISLAKTEKEVIYLNQLNNLRLICKKCNQEKGDKIEHPELLLVYKQWQHHVQNH